MRPTTAHAQCLFRYPRADCPALSRRHNSATAAPPAKAAEDRYIAARDAAIEKISAIYDAGNIDDAARKAEEAASADLAARMRAILNEPARDGFRPAKLNIDTFNKGDEGFGMLDGLRFDARLGKNGETAGPTGADGKYVAPKAHIIVTTQTLLKTTSGPKRSAGRPTTSWETCAKRVKTNTSAASRRMRQSRPPLRKQPGRRERLLVGGSQYALSRSTLALARIRRRASSAERFRMIFIAICGCSRR